ncbi:hypothetical protein F5880DRAFT_1644136 [Lentinula raphanica]|nr:hypothetical protein F5880DRAFT_1644136 [Lentinula raphanica]
MSRRSRRALRILYGSRRSRSISLADGPGFLYAYVDDGHLWKIGMTKNIARRKREWNRQCPSSNRRWMPAIANLWFISCWSFGAQIDLELTVHTQFVDSGTILTDEGKEQKVSFDFEPHKPINTSLYLCDNKFHTEALSELLESDSRFGFIVVDGNGTLFGILAGNTR